MKKFFIACVPVVSIIFFSCEKNFDVDIPEQEPRIVIGMMHPTGEPLTGTISKSRGILTPGDPASPNAQYRVNDAQVLLYENNLLFDNLVYNAVDQSYKTANNKMFTAGRTYRITAAAPGLNMVEATITAPAIIAITGITHIPNARTSASGDILDDITVTFNDPATENDHYLFRVLRSYPFDPRTYLDVPCIYSSDVDVERTTLGDDPFDPDDCISTRHFVLMRDKNFNGRTKQLKISVYSGDISAFTDPATGIEYKPVFELWHITEAEYKYRKSRQAYDNADGNPFAEPVQVYSNVQRGYGVFSIHSVARDTIR